MRRVRVTEHSSLAGRRPNFITCSESAASRAGFSSESADVLECTPINCTRSRASHVGPIRKRIKLDDAVVDIKRAHQQMINCCKASNVQQLRSLRNITIWLHKFNSGTTKKTEGTTPDVVTTVSHRKPRNTMMEVSSIADISSPSSASAATTSITDTSDEGDEPERNLNSKFNNGIALERKRRSPEQMPPSGPQLGHSRRTCMGEPSDGLHVDTMAMGQRWYNNVCNTRFETKYGVMTETIDMNRSR